VALRRRRRGRVDLLLGAGMILAVAAAILIHQGPGTSKAIATSSPQPAVLAFAQSYLRYLDGQLPASSIPDATPQVRSIAAGAQPIPPDARRGALKLVSARLTYVRGALSAQAVAVGRDQKHAYGASLVLRYVGGRWAVVYMVPPDVPTITAVGPPRPAPPPALERAATTFALAYGAYREGARRAPPAGSATMTQQIATGRDPLASIAPSHVGPRLVSIQIGPAVQGAASASAVLSDHGHRLRFDFDLEQSGAQWQAMGFPEAS
jgi:hypothetical protein